MSEFLHCPINILTSGARFNTEASLRWNANTCRYSLLKCGFSVAIMGYKMWSLALPVLYLESGKNRKPQCLLRAYSFLQYVKYTARLENAKVLMSKITSLKPNFLTFNF
jgi:hypothetical protein